MEVVSASACLCACVPVRLGTSRYGKVCHSAFARSERRWQTGKNILSGRHLLQHLRRTCCCKNNLVPRQDMPEKLFLLPSSHRVSQYSHSSPNMDLVPALIGLKMNGHVPTNPHGRYQQLQSRSCIRTKQCTRWHTPLLIAPE